VSIGVSDNDFLITSVGRLVYSKGTPEIVQAISHLGKSEDQVKLVLVGEGEYRKEIMHLDPQLRRRIVLAGEVDHLTALRIIAASDMYVSASLGEGGGIAILEAARHGVPIVASRAGGVTESMTDGVEGLLCDVGDFEAFFRKVTTLYERPDLRIAIGASASQFAEKWPSWDEVALYTKKILNKTLSTYWHVNHNRSG
jgi:glycosyltransferase involved in cell wall biosynthesis